MGRGYLMEQAKRLAAHGNTALRMLVEGLRRILTGWNRARQFRLRKVSFKGNGLQRGMAGASWQQIRDAAYEGRGA